MGTNDNGTTSDLNNLLNKYIEERGKLVDSLSNETLEYDKRRKIQKSIDAINEQIEGLKNRLGFDDENSEEFGWKVIDGNVADKDNNVNKKRNNSTKQMKETSRNSVAKSQYIDEDESKLEVFYTKYGNKKCPYCTRTLNNLSFELSIVSDEYNWEDIKTNTILFSGVDNEPLKGAETFIKEGSIDELIKSKVFNSKSKRVHTDHTRTRYYLISSNDENGLKKFNELIYFTRKKNQTDQKLMDLKRNIFTDGNGYKRISYEIDEMSTDYIDVFPCCTGCGMRLPTGFIENDSDIKRIVMIGGTHSGKTTYTSAILAGIEEELFGDNVGEEKIELVTDYNQFDSSDPVYAYWGRNVELLTSGIPTVQTPPSELPTPVFINVRKTTGDSYKDIFTIGLFDYPGENFAKIEQNRDTYIIEQILDAFAYFVFFPADVLIPTYKLLGLEEQGNMQKNAKAKNLSITGEELITKYNGVKSREIFKIYQTIKKVITKFGGKKNIVINNKCFEGIISKADMLVDEDEFKELLDIKGNLEDNNPSFEVENDSQRSANIEDVLVTKHVFGNDTEKNIKDIQNKQNNVHWSLVSSGSFSDKAEELAIIQSKVDNLTKALEQDENKENEEMQHELTGLQQKLEKIEEEYDRDDFDWIPYRIGDALFNCISVLLDE